MTDISKLGLGAFIRGEANLDVKEHKDHRFPFLLGVELELERVRGLNGENIPGGWTLHDDPSLREGREFVTKRPMAGPQVEPIIDNFYKANYRYTVSPRTSTHIHINIGQDTVADLRAMMIVSYALEEALFRSLQANRKWCGYCMPLSEMRTDRLRKLLSTDNSATMQMSINGNGNADKYYGFNVNSVRKHGTVEFRYFPGGPTKRELLSWIDYCVAIKKMAKEVGVAGFRTIDSAASLMIVLKKYLGEDWAMRLDAASGEDAIFRDLQEVLALLPDENEYVRRNVLLRANVPVLRFMSRHVLTDSEQFARFETQLSKLGVVGSEDWNTLVFEALRATKKTTKSKADKEIWYNLEDELMRRNPIPGRAPPPPLAGRPRAAPNYDWLVRAAADNAVQPQPADPEEQF